VVPAPNRHDCINTGRKTPEQKRIDAITIPMSHHGPMQTRLFGSTGIEVSAIGLGAWQLVRSAQWPDGPDEPDAVRLVHAALDAGVTFIDTAPGYADGRSEPTIGRAIAGRRDRVVLCTKFGHTPEGGTDFSATAIEASVRRSAQRMGVDHLDVVVLHNPPPEVLDGTRGEHYEVLEDLRDAGLIRAFGASVDTGEEVETMLATSAATALEVRLSALYQQPWDAVGHAGGCGLGTIVKVPLESGWLSGRYDGNHVFTDVRSRWSTEDVALRARLVGELRDLLPTGISLLDGALRFLLAHDAVSTVVPGTRTVQHLRTSIAAASEPLPPATVDAIRAWYATTLADSPLDW
jgi:aryl-alcohol dehydrogenase-like predicted oxidoreductase